MDAVFITLLNMSITASWLILAVILLRFLLKRAPKWINRIGMEWLYRLVRDPKRMFKRYIINEMKIFKLAWRYRKR